MAEALGVPSGSWLAEACKAIIAFRGLALLLTLVWIPGGTGEIPLLAVAVILAAIASIVPLVRWNRVSSSLLRHPSYLAAEVVLALVILLLAGTESPFFLFTLGTAALAGLVYGFPGAILFSSLLTLSYLWAFSVREELDGLSASFENVLSQPLLYPVAAFSAAATRRLFERHLAASAAAGEREREVAAERERVRLARDMHDSLAKTVHGIALEASALRRRIERDPDDAAAHAQTLAADAESAAREARGLIHGLREEGTGPAPQALREHTEGWARDAGILVVDRIGEVDVSAVVRHELLHILSEALRNVARHAGASRVEVILEPTPDGGVRLAVRDDGAGFDPGDQAHHLDGLHFGLAGMRERAVQVGGGCLVSSRMGAGTTIEVMVPRASGRSKELA